MAIDFKLFKRPTFRVYYLTLCSKCGEVTEYIARLPDFPCAFCNPACKERGQHAKLYARRFEPVKHSTE